MMAPLILVVLGILGASLEVSCSNLTNNYENYTLMRVYPDDSEGMAAIVRFEDPENRVEILKRSRGLNDSLDLLIPPDRMGFIENFVQSDHLHNEVKERNYGRTLESTDRVPKRRSMRKDPIYEYNSYAAMQDFMETVAKKHPELVKLQTLGRSSQGRLLTLVKISSNPSAGNPIILVDAGIHAREWVAPSMALYLMHRLTNDPEARARELAGVDWYIIPVVNPDGYEYSRSIGNRMWRKTMSNYRLGSGDSCFGVDGNRNYGFKWAVSGVSNNPCDKETYAGPKPFSEPETAMIRNVMMDNKDRIKLYVSLHAYGQYLVYPWGYTGNYLPKDWKKLDRLGRIVSAAVVRAGGQPFKVMSAGQWYPAAGGSDDYAFGAVKVPYSYTMELTDGYEFIYPEELLRNTLPRFYQGFRAFGSQIRKEFGKERKKREADPCLAS